jgi:hypothetical protein
VLNGKERFFSGPHVKSDHQPKLGSPITRISITLIVNLQKFQCIASTSHPPRSQCQKEGRAKRNRCAAHTNSFNLCQFIHITARWHQVRFIKCPAVSGLPRDGTRRDSRSSELSQSQSSLQGTSEGQDAKNLRETARVSADVEKDATTHAPIVESPNPVPVEPQSFQDKPTETADEKTLLAKQARRTTKLLNIRGCDTCDEVISEVEKRDRSLVAKCTKKGCKMRWVSQRVDLACIH